MLSGRIHEIRTIFDQNPTLVRNQTLPHTEQQKRVLELEAKYGYYTGNRFNSNVPYIHYERLLNLLRATPNIGLEEIEESSVAQSGNIRRVTITNAGDAPEVVIWERKERLRDIELTDYDIRVSINTEERLRQEEIQQPFNPNVIRERTRHTFIIANGIIKVDMTEVMMRGEDKVIRPRYEVELEHLGTREDLPIFAQQVEFIFKLLRGTNLIYTNQVKNLLIRDTNAILGTTREGMIDKEVIVEARNIKRRDLVYGGIVGNQSIDDEKMLSAPRRPEKRCPGTNYVITYKADGLRKMLIIHTTGIWLVYPPFEFNLVLNTTLNVPQLDKFLTAFNGTVFDGELVIPKTPKQIKYWYLAFDCLAFQRVAGIQLQSYIQRQTVVSAISQALKTPILTVDTKATQEIKTPKDFFRLVRQFLDNRDKLEYYEDGLMFIPIDTRYNPLSQRYKLQERSLTRIPDVCKWKEGADITIDFALKWVEGGLLELHSYDEESQTTVPFRGDAINPLTLDMIEHTNPLTLNKPANLVVEYEWIKVNPNDIQEGIKDTAVKTTGFFRPRRIRYDKQGPNRLYIALDDWEDIMNPITAEDIRGETLTMTFSYHNRIKKSLYDILTVNPDYNPRVKTATATKRFVGANILDIGSGRGGDTAKWKRLTDRANPNTTGFVVAVEPNEENRQYLVNRVATFGLQDKVTIVPTGGEDTATITDTVRRYIPGGKVDAVTLMLSMSFFWASYAHLDALISTIVNNLKPGGKIVFLTIDGDTIEQLFEPALGGPIITDMTIASTKLHLYPRTQPPFGRPLDFILPDTIVGDQHEYIVHLQDFTSRLATYGLYPYEVHRAEGEKLLSTDNALFSSMYSFGYYQNDDEIALLQHEQTGRLPVNTILPVIPVPTKFPAIQMNPNTTSPTITILATPLPTLTPGSPRSPVLPKPPSPIIQRQPSPQTTVRVPSPRAQSPLPSPRTTTIVPQVPQPRPQSPLPSPRTTVVVPQVPQPAVVVPQIPQPTVVVPQIPQPTVVVPQIPQPTVVVPQIPQPTVVVPQIPQPAVVVPQVPQPTVVVPQIPQPTVVVPQIPQPTVVVPQIPQPTVVVPQIPQPTVVVPQIPQTGVPVPTLPKPTKYQIDNNQLRRLSVTYTGRGGVIVRGQARNDDTYAPLTCTWYEDLVRIATIGDGSCFIHAVLKAFYRAYQENNGAGYRLDLAARIRRDLAVALGLENPQYPGHTYWETCGSGSFPRMVMQQINDENLVRDLRVDYSLAGLQRLFNSTSQLGDEVYKFVADSLNIDIYVLRATTQDLYPHYHTRTPGILRNGVVIIGNMYHYETLGIDTDYGIQTVFPPGDPFLDALTNLFVGDGDVDIINAVPYDPDDAFVHDFVDAFTTRYGLAIPYVINEIFQEIDPFRLALARLMPRIEDVAALRAADLAVPQTATAQANPVITQLNQILRIMEESGYSPEEAQQIRQIVEHRLDLDTPQTLDEIVAAAQTDGLLNREQVYDIINVQATL